MMYRDNFRQLKGLIAPFVITLVPLALILQEPDLGSALLFVPVLFAMMFAAGIRLRHLLLVVLLGNRVLADFLAENEHRTKITCPRPVHADRQRTESAR